MNFCSFSGPVPAPCSSCQSRALLAWSPRPVLLSPVRLLGCKGALCTKKSCDKLFQRPPLLPYNPLAKGTVPPAAFWTWTIPPAPPSQAPAPLSTGGAPKVSSRLLAPICCCRFWLQGSISRLPGVGFAGAAAVRGWVLAVPCKLFPPEPFSGGRGERGAQRGVHLQLLPAAVDQALTLRKVQCFVLMVLLRAAHLVHLLVNYFKHIFGCTRFQELAECNH